MKGGNERQEGVLVVMVLMTLMQQASSNILQGIVSQWIGMNIVRVYIAMKCNAT